MTDEQRERLIEAWRVVLELERLKEFQTIGAGRMRDLIAERPPERIQQMERERGLRVP